MTPDEGDLRHELNTLMFTMADAVDLAQHEKPAEGYSALKAGLMRAAEAQEDGEPWAAERVGRWREACELFAESWGLRVA